MGDVVNSAAKLASKGSMGLFATGPLMVGTQFRYNLKDHNKALLSWNSTHSCYVGSPVITSMEEWHRVNCS